MPLLTPAEHQTLRLALADALGPHQSALAAWIGALARLGLVDLADMPLSASEADQHFSDIHGAFRRVNVAGRELMRRADRLLDALRDGQLMDQTADRIRLLSEVTGGLPSHSDRDAAIRALGYWTWDQVNAYARRTLLEFADHYVRAAGEATPLRHAHLRAQAAQFADDLEASGSTSVASTHCTHSCVGGSSLQSTGGE